MTVTYTAEVATCRGLGCFWKLLFRWRGSIYKLLWPNLILYSFCYFTLSAVYRFALGPEQKKIFENISLYCHSHSDLIPVSFVLGFYVSIVIKRWWDQYMGIPWPDSLAMFVSTLVHGNDDRGRLMRRTILRYVNLSFVITLSMMCPRVKKRFPTLDHLVEAGFMQPNEKNIFDDLDSKTQHPKYWMPLVWAGSIVTRARKEGRVRDDFSMKTLIDGLCTFRGQCGGMLNYDWISIPLVYTQVVTLAVYIFFLATLMGHQFLDPQTGTPDMKVDLVMPLFTFLQFFFYMGWLKVAESLVNPFGEDDDDFEVNWLVDRNLQVSYLIVDEMHQEHPELVKDQYWDEVFPAELPYTAAAKQYQTGPPQGSTKSLDIPPDQVEFMPMETVLEESERNLLNDDEDEIIMHMDDIQLDLEHGLKRKETHPMRILMGRKASVSSKLSMQSSSVAGGGTNAQGVRGRAGEMIEGMGRSLLGLSYSSTGTKGMAGSYHQKNQSNAHHPPASYRPSGKKNSMLSVLTRMFSREDGNRGELRSNLGSNASLRSHRRGPFGRSISRVSCSQANSRSSINRENTADFQDEIFKMSDLSICGSTENDIHLAQQRQRKHSHQQRHGRRRLSARLSTAEASADPAMKEEGHAQDLGEETPSTVASTPVEGERLIGKRVWVTKEKKKPKQAEKERSGELDHEEEFEDEERDEEEDNGIWFSNKKIMLAKKASCKEALNEPNRRDVSKSPTESSKIVDAGVDDLSMVSDSSVKTSFYHGSWDTLAESKGLGSITTVASSYPAVVVESPPTINITADPGSEKCENEGDPLHISSMHGKEWVQSSEPWAGNGKMIADLPHLGQSLGSGVSFPVQCTARIVVPKRSETPLKHVFESNVSSYPSPQSSFISRGRVTSQLARGIAQMAASKEGLQPVIVQANNLQENHQLIPSIPKKSDTNENLSASNKELTGELIDTSPKPNSFGAVQTILPPPSSPVRWNLIGSNSNDPVFNRATNGHENSPTLLELEGNFESKDLLSMNTSNTSRLQPSNLDTSVKPVQSDSLDGSNLGFPKDLLSVNNHSDDSVIPKEATPAVTQEVVDFPSEPCDSTTEIAVPKSELTTEDNLYSLAEIDHQRPEPSLLFLPHIPSTAIPVPSMSPAYNSCEEMQSDGDEAISVVDECEGNKGVGFGGDMMKDRNSDDSMESMGGRRRMGGLRDFVELEPIEENIELGGNNSSLSRSDRGISNETGLSKEDIPPETSV